MPCLSFLNDIFAEMQNSNLVDTFSFRTQGMSFHCLLLCIFSFFFFFHVKAAVIFIVILLYVMHLFFFLQQSDRNEPTYGFVYFSHGLWNYVDIRIDIFITFGKFLFILIYLSALISFSSFSGIPNSHMLNFDIIPQFFEAWLIFSNFFSLCASVCIVSIGLSSASLMFLFQQCLIYCKFTHFSDEIPHLFVHYVHPFL